MNGEIISIETAAYIASLEKENKELKGKLLKAEEAAKRIIDLAYQLDELDNQNPNIAVIKNRTMRYGIISKLAGVTSDDEEVQ